MRNSIFFTALSVIVLAGCATGAVSPMAVTDAPKSRVYLDDYAGDGYRIKVTRDSGTLGSLCMTQLYVDDKLAAEIGQAETVIFKVSPGSHKLKASPSFATSICKKIYSAPQFHVEETVVGNPGDIRIYRYGWAHGGVPALTPSVNL